MLTLLFLTALSTAPVRLATYEYPAFDRRAALGPLAREIEAELSRPVEIVLFATPDALGSALRRGEVELAVTNLAAYAQSATNDRVTAIAVLDVPAETLDGYRGVLLARRDAGIETPAALRARAASLRYAEVLPGSTSGALVQAGHLAAVQLQPDSFGVRTQAGTHEKVLASLLAGDTDLGAMAEAPWRALLRTKPDTAALLTELWRSPPLPPGPVVCVRSRSLPCDRIARRLLRTATAAPMLARGWAETSGALRFIRPDPRRYRVFLRPAGR